jgi:hypothetical protein
MAISASGVTRATARSGERFFLVMSILLAVLVIASFAPSFYLRPFLLPESGFRYGTVLPTHLYVHGAFLTAWYLLLPTQAVLVANSKMDWHRSFGVLGIFIVVGTVPTAFLAIVRGPAAGPIAAVDVMGIATFAICVGLAIAARTRPSEHKRLMLVASIAPMPMVFARVELLAANVGIRLPSSSAVVATVILLAVIVGYDLAVHRRPHRGTVKGLFVTFVAVPLLAGAFVASGLAELLAELAR